MGKEGVILPTRLITARRILPVDRPPIARGFVAIGADGRITAVGAQADLPAERWGLIADDYPDGTVIPGLINLHTHLEYSHIPPGPGPLHAWILRLIERTRDWTGTDRLTSALTGIRHSVASGVTCVADTSPSGASLMAARQVGLRGVFYQEAFGLDDGEAAIQRLTDRLDDLATGTGPHQRLGISPHAPYTISLPLWRKLLRLAGERQLPLSTHLAESPAEIAWYAGLPSDVPAYHAALRLPGYQPPAGHPVSVLANEGLLTDGLLAAHCVHVGPVERQWLHRSGVIAVHCPLSNAGLACGTAGVAAWEAEGLLWGMGTDSPASSGNLDLWKECRQPSVSGLGWDEARWLRKLTLEAAAHLGMADAIGSLTPGKWADLAVLQPPGGSPPGPMSLSEQAIGCVLVAGEDLLDRLSCERRPTSS
jgi:5-methylthioadenosine/S-adenosylhomocysteine deaminase